MRRTATGRVSTKPETTWKRTHPSPLPVVRREPLVVQVIHVVAAHFFCLGGQVAEDVLLITEELIVVDSDQLVFCTAGLDANFLAFRI